MIVKTLKWRESQEEPTDINAPVLYCTSNGKLGVFKDTKTCLGVDTSKMFSDWKGQVRKYNIKY